MVNKFKSLLKKEKGFTLVELLAVIVILGIIVAIAIPAIGNIIDNARGDANVQEQALVIDAARLYEVQKNVTGDYSITADDLIELGFLDYRSGEAPSGGVKKENGEYEYDPNLSTSDPAI